MTRTRTSTVGPYCPACAERNDAPPGAHGMHCSFCENYFTWTIEKIPHFVTVERLDGVAMNKARLRRGGRRA